MDIGVLVSVSVDNVAEYICITYSSIDYHPI